MSNINKDNLPEVLVIGAGKVHGVNVNMIKDEPEEAAKIMGEAINEMTKSHFEKAECD